MLRVLQKSKVNLAEDFFGVFPRKEARKLLKHFRGEFGAKFGEKIGTNFEKFGELSFCNFFKRRLLQKSEGNFSEQSPGEFSGGFLVFFFWGGGRFPWKKDERIHPKNPRQNSNKNLGASRPKSTLQGSGLDIHSLEYQMPKSHNNPCPIFPFFFLEILLFFSARTSLFLF